MAGPRKFLPLLLPGLTVFVSCACVMVVELIAGRIIAPFLGSSLYTWTSVIGVVLAGITIGNYLGGWVADRYRPARALILIFALASVSCLAVLAINESVGRWMAMDRLAWPLRILVHVSAVFLTPSLILGLISPVVAKMALDRGCRLGRTLGNIYACGAAGSILGTFLTGYYLIAVMPVTEIVWSVAAVMMLLACCCWVYSRFEHPEGA